MTVFHWIGDFLRTQLDRVPLFAARWLFIGLYLVLIYWLVQLPSKETNPTDRPHHWSKDLKNWAWLTLLLQVIIYSVF